MGEIAEAIMDGPAEEAEQVMSIEQTLATADAVIAEAKAVDAEAKKLLGYVDDARPDVGPGWSPTSIVDVDWCLQRMGELQAEAAEVNRLADEAMSRIAFRRKLLLERVNAGLSFFEGQVKAYAEAHRAEILKGGKKKSRDLMYGRLAWTKTRAGLEVKDEQAALEWARQQPIESGVLRIKEELSKSAINKHVEKTGEIPPGCELKDERDELKVTLAERAALGAGKEQ